MPVVIITKKTLISVVVLAVLLMLAIVLLCCSGGKKENDGTATPTMAVVEEYELNALPVLSRELPVYGVSRDDKKIALTIDAAWNTDKTEFILDTLDKYEIKATFFLCGVWVDAYPDYVKEISVRGHEIGNHSLTHPHMNNLSASQVQEEITKLDDRIEELTGSRCSLFRAPYGEYNNTVITAVRDINYEVIQWTKDTVDWKESRTAEQILNGVLPNLQSGDIILCHNNGYKIEQYLPVLIESALSEGYSFVTVSELLLQGDTIIDNQGLQKTK
ncbi:MAG: polysaccharide deacetylase family protein [Eubacteriales bacterium]|nr:polysaccharide deacetylase family protein [Eubacteriales bacterium]